MTSKEATVHKAIEAATIAYLTLPIIIFSFGWLKLVYAVLVLAVVCLALYAYWRQISQPNDLPVRSKRVGVWVVCAVLLTGWVVVSGAGGIGRQTADYNKHNALMSDLVTHEWPVTYLTDQGNRPLVYYTAYYLPAAAVGKVFHNVYLANLCMLPWAALGVLLSFYWLFRLSKGNLYVLTVLFIFFSGMDILGQVIVRTTENTIPLLDRYSSMEWYAQLKNMQYSSDTTLLNWVPQQAITGWLFTGVIISKILEKRNALLLLFLVSVSFLWAPLVSLGLLPIIAGAGLIYGRSMIKNLDWRLLPAIGALTIVLGLYYLAGNTHQPSGSFLSFTYPNWGWEKKLAVLLVFLIVEFGALAALLAPYVRRHENREWKILFAVTVLFLCVLPLLRYGIFNDLVMRASIPSLFVLVAITARYLNDSWKSPQVGRAAIIHSAVICVLAIGSITPMVEFNIHLRGSYKHPDYWYSIGNQNLNAYEKSFTAQYLGKDQSIFFYRLARPIGR